MTKTVYKVVRKDSLKTDGEYSRAFATREEALAKAKRYAIGAEDEQYVVEVKILDEVTLANVDAMVTVTSV